MNTYCKPVLRGVGCPAKRGEDDDHTRHICREEGMAGNVAGVPVPPGADNVERLCGDAPDAQYSVLCHCPGNRNGGILLRDPAAQ